MELIQTSIPDELCASIHIPDKLCSLIETLNGKNESIGNQNGSLSTLCQATSGKLRIVLFAGVSAGGKDTTASALMKKYPQTQKIIRTTSRPPRQTEQEGKDYFFVDSSYFRDHDTFLGYEARGPQNACVYYGIEKNHVDEVISRAKEINAPVIGITGVATQELVEYLLDRHGSEFIITVPFLYCDPVNMIYRLWFRGEHTKKDIQYRLEGAIVDIAKGLELAEKHPSMVRFFNTARITTKELLALL